MRFRPGDGPEGHGPVASRVFRTGLVCLLMGFLLADISWAAPSMPATWDDSLAWSAISRQDGERLSQFLNTAYQSELARSRDPRVKSWVALESRRAADNAARARTGLSDPGTGPSVTDTGDKSVGGHAISSVAIAILFATRFLARWTRWRCLCEPVPPVIVSVVSQDRWKRAALRFVARYADEQRRLVALFNTVPSEIEFYPSEEAGWNLPDKTLVLSFDDGPSPEKTARILKELRAEQVPAVFFLLGQSLMEARQSSRIPDYSGVQVGSHTFSHAFLVGSSFPSIRRQFEQTDEELRRAHLPRARLFRAPYGARRLRELAFIEERGLQSILWNIDSQDWQGSMQQGQGRISHRIVALALLRRRGIILCHDTQSPTADMLPATIRLLKRLGFRFVRVGTKANGVVRAKPGRDRDLTAGRKRYPAWVEQGLAWGRGLHPAEDLEGPRKREGDKKSPAGIYRISGAFGFAPTAVARSFVQMPYTHVTGDIECVDDPDSPVYNRIVDRKTISPTPKSSERMLRFDVYRWGAVIDQSPSPVRPRSGSCVFLHVWNGPGQGTAGCTAMDEQVLKALLK